LRLLSLAIKAANNKSLARGALTRTLNIETALPEFIALNQKQVFTFKTSN